MLHFVLKDIFHCLSGVVGTATLHHQVVHSYSSNSNVIIHCSCFWPNGQWPFCGLSMPQRPINEFTLCLLGHIVII